MINISSWSFNEHLRIFPHIIQPSDILSLLFILLVRTVLDSTKIKELAFEYNLGAIESWNHRNTDNDKLCPDHSVNTCWEYFHMLINYILTNINFTFYCLKSF